MSIEVPDLILDPVLFMPKPNALCFIYSDYLSSFTFVWQSILPYQSIDELLITPGLLKESEITLTEGDNDALASCVARY